MINRWLIRRARRQDAKRIQQSWDKCMRMSSKELEEYKKLCDTLFWESKLPTYFEQAGDNQVTTFRGVYDPGQTMHDILPESMAQLVLNHEPHNSAADAKGSVCVHCSVSWDDIRAAPHNCPRAPWRYDPRIIYKLVQNDWRQNEDE